MFRFIEYPRELEGWRANSPRFSHSSSESGFYCYDASGSISYETIETNWKAKPSWKLHTIHLCSCDSITYRISMYTRKAETFRLHHREFNSQDQRRLLFPPVMFPFLLISHFFRFKFVYHFHSRNILSPSLTPRASCLPKTSYFPIKIICDEKKASAMSKLEWKVNKNRNGNEIKLWQCQSRETANPPPPLA